MPTPKAGTVTTDVAKAIAEVKAGKIEFKSDKHGVINTPSASSLSIRETQRESCHYLAAIFKQSQQCERDLLSHWRSLQRWGQG